LFSVEAGCCVILQLNKFNVTQYISIAGEGEMDEIYDVKCRHSASNEAISADAGWRPGRLKTFGAAKFDGEGTGGV
jgi:hypothetical protein